MFYFRLIRTVAVKHRPSLYTICSQKDSFYHDFKQRHQLTSIKKLKTNQRTKEKDKIVSGPRIHVNNIPGSPEGKPQEWAMIELQGTLETRHPVPLSGRFIGDLHFTHKDVPVLIIGHHILYGKAVNLEKPYAVMVKETVESSSQETGQTDYNIIAIIKKKLLFKTRPKPIIANVPKKL